MKIFNFGAFLKNKVAQKGQKSILMGSLVGLDPNTPQKKFCPFLGLGVIKCVHAH